jgi:hypothetical protein
LASQIYSASFEPDIMHFAAGLDGEGSTHKKHFMRVL